MPQGMRDLFASLIPAMLQTGEGKTAFKTAYDIDQIEPVNDGYYEDFHIYVGASGVDLTTLIK